MRKIFKMAVLAVVCCLVMSIFAGCSGGEEGGGSGGNELVGTWEGTGDEGATITFKSNGNFSEKGISKDADMSGTYTIDETNKRVVCTEKEYGLVFDYNYTISGNDLTLQMDIGYPRTFTKK